MPELPEVEVVRHGLYPLLAGTRIDRLDVVDERALITQSRRAPVYDIRQLAGSNIVDVRRRGKYLWLTTGSHPDNAVLVIHLGMSGQMRDGELNAPAHKHERIRMSLTRLDTGEQTMVRFIDQRIFGWMVLDFPSVAGTSHGGAEFTRLPAWAGGACGAGDVSGISEGDRESLIPAVVAHIAPDLLDPHLDVAAVAHQIRTSTRPIKSALLDQGLVSGIGNIYVAEALWAAGINPRRSSNRVSANRIVAALSAAAKVMAISLSNGGTSFDKQYVNVNGLAGEFSGMLNVYGRAGQPCLRCGHLLQNVVVQGRATVYCPGCQH